MLRRGKLFEPGKLAMDKSIQSLIKLFALAEEGTIPLKRPRMDL